MNPDRVDKETHDELKTEERLDAALSTVANGESLNGGAQDETANGVFALTNSNGQPNAGTGIQCLPDLVGAAGDRPAQWENELETATEDLPSENMNLLNQTVQALFYQARRFAKKGEFTFRFTYSEFHCNLFQLVPAL